MIHDTPARAVFLRRARFVGINLAVAAVLTVFVIAPLLSAVIDAAEAIADRADQLGRLKVIAGNAAQLGNGAGKADDVYLAGSEERLASADLQANLKAVAGAAGVRFLSIRGVTPGRAIAPRMVAVSLDLEGAPAALREALRRIEMARPMLFVTSMMLRPGPGSAEGILRAELTVQGAMRDAAVPAAVAEQLP